jgi:hypothetical protein
MYAWISISEPKPKGAKIIQFSLRGQGPQIVVTVFANGDKRFHCHSLLKDWQEKKIRDGHWYLLQVCETGE